jgi:hypothetical protein
MTRYPGQGRQSFLLRQSEAGRQAFGRRWSPEVGVPSIPLDVLTWDLEPVTHDLEYVTFAEAV